MKGRDGKCRPFTAKEAREAYLRHFLSAARYWADLPGKTARERTEGAVFSVLAVLDGAAIGLPAVDVALVPHPDDE